MNKPLEVHEILNQFKASFVKVEGGRFCMGGTSEQGQHATTWEKPTHYVCLDDFAISKYPVTQKLWKAIMPHNPSVFCNEENPVENVSWHDCKTFIDKLNQSTGLQFSLPTEAQWEYAARGGVKSKKYIYSGSNTPEEVAWVIENSRATVMPVGQKKPNELGIFDMSGNVYEWCEDFYNKYSDAEQKNPIVLNIGNTKIVRGGSYNHEQKRARISYRGSFDPTYADSKIGFRLVCGVNIIQEKTPLETSAPTTHGGDALAGNQHNPIQGNAQSQQTTTASPLDQIKRTIKQLNDELEVFIKYETRVPDRLISQIREAEESEQKIEKGMLIDELCQKIKEHLNSTPANLQNKQTFTLDFHPENGISLTAAPQDRAN